MFLKKKKENHNLAFVVIRPPGHHSHACLPSGFCLLNNVQIGIEYAFEQYGVTHCAILDIDLHHGDGSQDICWERAGFTGDYGQQEEDEIIDPKLNPRDDYGKRFATFPKVGYFHFMISNLIQQKSDMLLKKISRMHPLVSWIMI